MILQPSKKSPNLIIIRAEQQKSRNFLPENREQYVERNKIQQNFTEVQRQKSNYSDIVKLMRSIRGEKNIEEEESGLWMSPEA